MSTQLPRLHRDDTLFLFVDIQQKLLPAMFEAERVVRACTLLARAAAQMQIPVVVVEQYPKMLGTTAPMLREALPEYSPIAKMRFSACVQETMDVVRASGKKTIVLCGIETHVCVMQSALDLVEEGFTVFVPHDAVSSRYESDKKAALARLSSIGAVPCSTEMVIFELLREAGTPDFKALLQHIK